MCSNNLNMKILLTDEARRAKYISRILKLLEHFYFYVLHLRIRASNVVKTWCLILQVVHVVILLRVLARIRLVPSRFSCLRDDWWEGLSEFALQQGKGGRKTGNLARISQISLETTGYEFQPECRSGGNKWSYVRSFIILRPGEGLTSNKHTVLTFLVNHKYNEVFRGVYFLTFREISFSYSNLKVCNNTNYVVQIKPTRPAFTISGFPISILWSFNSCSKLSY